MCSLIKKPYVSPITSINTFSGARSGKIKADFYGDYQDIP